jgi:hypothetical protein
MRIRLEEGRYGTYLLRAENGASLLIQIDWDLADVATAFGWKPCHCRHTDGTIACRHHTVAEMLAEARKYLGQHLGETADDPGYFSSTVPED